MPVKETPESRDVATGRSNTTGLHGAFPDFPVSTCPDFRLTYHSDDRVGQRCAERSQNGAELRPGRKGRGARDRQAPFASFADPVQLAAWF